MKDSPYIDFIRRETPYKGERCPVCYQDHELEKIAENLYYWYKQNNRNHDLNWCRRVAADTMGIINRCIEWE